MRSFSLNLALLFAAMVITLLGAEVALRWLGYRPWQVKDIKISVEPGGKFFAKDDLLGYRHLPGAFKVTLADGYSFKVTHNDDALRLTHPLESHKSGHDEIWIFGCSFTHGWTLNDEETYPWLLQTQLPQYEIVNFGVSGYGTLQSLLQFQEALQKRAKPKLVIVAYASFHDQRNTFLRVRRKQIVPWNKLGPIVQPYAELDGNGNLTYHMAEVTYQEFPLMRYSALMNFVETTYNTKVEDAFYHSHAVTKAIIQEFAKVAHAQGIKFVLVGLLSDALTADMLAYSRDQDIASADISVDLAIRANRNLPHDPHPGPAANRQYAQKLQTFLDGINLKD